MKPKVTIAIPAYNAERTIGETIASCQMQEYPLKEILVLDDGSTDNTGEVDVVFSGVRCIRNETNMGIGHSLVRLMNEAKGKYVIYLCSDDVFTHPMVVSDIAKIFDSDSRLGVICRYYYQFMDGYTGAIMVCRDNNILTSSCNPSGMAFRKTDGLIGTNKIFIEMPSIVAQYLPKWRWTMMPWDTIAARIHPGGNTGTKKSYYNESPIVNWVSIVGKDYRFNQGFIQLKNRAPHMLWQEIKNAWKLTPGVRTDPLFWFYAATAILVPGFILRPLANFYRHRITRRFVKIIERPE